MFSFLIGSVTVMDHDETTKDLNRNGNVVFQDYFSFYQIIPLLILVHLQRNRICKENTSNYGVNIFALTAPGWILLTLEQKLWLLFW